ncbi:CaiB/BaiF CoA transferase family protein [Parvibium lacunae]|uniref:CoA transferase n=1 Tax=Parvibium lacunae TaxID=1888893 RepID=A0A368L449_9BURK|nr:CaiB/BaiF CoA-transferase family protein [Parvibium lacunae]RCS58263.1 CoA transferase [Parvibium lacunae]
MAETITPAQSQPPAGPLAGLKVLELGTLIAGPFAARLLAEFGAEVIKIESPANAEGQGGDPLRTWRHLHNGTSLWWAVQARNKHSLALNLKHPEGQRIALALVEEADIVIENFRPGTIEKLGLGEAELRARNPGLILVRISGFGQTGPYQDRPGFGAIGESMGGLRYVTGYPDRPPVRVGVSIGDSISSLHAVMGALMALHHRDKTRSPANPKGEGQVVDVALYESVFNMMESLVPEYAVHGAIRERTGASLPGIVPSNTYACADGQSIVIGGNGDAIFKRLMLVIGRPDLAGDPALQTNDGRVLQTEQIDTAIATWCAQQDRASALTALQAAEVPASQIYSVADMFQDPQFAARQMLESHQLADGTPITLPGITPKLSQTPGATRWLGPNLGEHTTAVLTRLGYTPAQIEHLREQGVI